MIAKLAKSVKKCGPRCENCGLQNQCHEQFCYIYVEVYIYAFALMLFILQCLWRGWSMQHH